MFIVQPEKKAERDATMYNRVQAANKTFVVSEAKRLNFENTAEYIDAVLTKLRLSAKGSKKAAKPAAKKASKKAAKKH